MRILRPVGGSTYFGAGISAASGNVPAGVTPPIPTKLAIKKGDFIGADNNAGANQLGTITHVGALNPLFNPPVPEGGNSGFFGVNALDFKINATVRYCLVPDVRREESARRRNRR